MPVSSIMPRMAAILRADLSTYYILLLKKKCIYIGNARISTVPVKI
jgi:hypothetical protein